MLNKTQFDSMAVTMGHMTK